MIALVCFVWSVLISPFKSDSRLEAENVALRHQVMVLRRQVRGPGASEKFRSIAACPALSLVSLDPAALYVVQPETVVTLFSLRRLLRCSA
jgi:hypothetical protein